MSIKGKTIKIWSKVADPLNLVGVQDFAKAKANQLDNEKRINGSEQYANHDESTRETSDSELNQSNAQLREVELGQNN